MSFWSKTWEISEAIMSFFLPFALSRGRRMDQASTATTATPAGTTTTTTAPGAIPLRPNDFIGKLKETVWPGGISRMEELTMFFDVIPQLHPKQREMLKDFFYWLKDEKGKFPLVERAMIDIARNMQRDEERTLKALRDWTDIGMRATGPSPSASMMAMYDHGKITGILIDSNEEYLKYGWEKTKEGVRALDKELTDLLGPGTQVSNTLEDFYKFADNFKKRARRKNRS